MKFYTNVGIFGNSILYRGVENGIRVKKKIPYSPVLYISGNSDTPAEFTTIYDKPLIEIQTDSIRDAKYRISSYDQMNIPVYGNRRFEYSFIGDEFPEELQWDPKSILVANLDIEVAIGQGFPEPSTALEEVLSIACKKGSQKYVFGCRDFNPADDVTYIKCNDEPDLLRKFVIWWSSDHPDIITGWNTKFFDIPYLVNRINKVLGEKYSQRLSPWNYLSERKVFIRGREQVAYFPSGIAMIDYLEAYKRFAPDGATQDSYRLDAVASYELGERKLSYEEYGSLTALYQDNYQLFIEYNIRDIDLIDKLESKLKLIQMIITIAYDSRTNYEDVFSQVRMWDIIVYNYLKKSNRIIPPPKVSIKNEEGLGAYVKEVKPGRYGWIVSEDLDSLYPHLMMQYNISPDTRVLHKDLPREVLSWMERSDISVESMMTGSLDLSILKKYNLTMTPNREFYRTDKLGFFAKIMEEMYEDRKRYKKSYIDLEKELESEKDPNRIELLTKEISKYKGLQTTKKVCLNSAYGALANPYFRFFNADLASSVPISGQLSIRWIEIKVNNYLNKVLGTVGEDYVIASDTDSIYINLNELVCETIIKNNSSTSSVEVVEFLDSVCKNKLSKVIDKAYGELAQYTNAVAQKMKMKREIIADQGIWTAKKRYITSVWDKEGVRYTEPRIKVVGLEMIKSSTPSSCRVKLEEIIRIILYGSEQKSIEFISNFKKEFKKLPIEDIASPRGVNGISNYTVQNGFKPNTPINIKGSIVHNRLIKELGLSNRYLPIVDGEKIKYIYLKQPNTVGSNSIAFVNTLPTEFGLEKWIDYDTQFDRAFLRPVKIILDSIGWKSEKRGSFAALINKKY